MQPRFHPNYSYLLGVLEVSPEIETKRKVVVNSDCACVTTGLFEAMNTVVRSNPYDVDGLD